MTRILQIGDSDEQAEDLSALAASSGIEVTRAPDAARAIESLRRQIPDVVLIDLDAPGIDGLALIKSVHKAVPAIPVLLMTAMKSDGVAEVLRHGGTGYIRKKNGVREVARTVENVLAVARVLSERKQVLYSLNEAEFSFVIGNDIADIAPLLACVEQIASILHPCDPTDRMRVNLALNEALLNAIQHGNLELSSDLRQENEDVFRNLGDERQSLSPYKDRRAFLRVALSRSEAVYTIEDEGQGFDPANVPDPTDDENLSRIGGRGLLLIRAFMDDVEHNEKGTRVTLRKKYTTAHCSASAGQ